VLGDVAEIGSYKIEQLNKVSTLEVV